MIDYEDQLCVWCARSNINGCSWAEDLTPVEGWTAEPSKQGWHVIECPLFVKETAETILPAKLDDRGVMALLEEAAKQMREDYVQGRGGPYDDFNKNRKREERKSPAEIRGANRQAIEKWLNGPVAGKLLQLSNTDEVIRMLRKMARKYETELMSWMR